MNTLHATDVRQIVSDLDATTSILERMESHPELRKLAEEYVNAARDRILRASLADVVVERVGVLEEAI